MLVALFAMGLYCSTWRVALVCIALVSPFSLAGALILWSLLGWTRLFYYSIKGGLDAV